MHPAFVMKLYAKDGADNSLKVDEPQQCHALGTRKTARPKEAAALPRGPERADAGL